MFRDVTKILSGPITNLSSTAVATANASMSGAVVQCFTSQIVDFATEIGPNSTLCIPGKNSMCTYPRPQAHSQFFQCFTVREPGDEANVHQFTHTYPPSMCKGY